MARLRVPACGRAGQSASPPPSLPSVSSPPIPFFFFFNDPAPTEISPLPLPAPLPISQTPAPQHVQRDERERGRFAVRGGPPQRRAQPRLPRQEPPGRRKQQQSGARPHPEIGRAHV